MSKAIEIQNKINKLQKELNELEDIGKVYKAIIEATTGTVESKNYSNNFYIKIKSPINFGYYRNSDKYDKIAKEIFPKLGIYIEHHDDWNGDDYDISYLTFDLDKNNIEDSIKQAKILMPNLKVSYTKTHIY